MARIGIEAERGRQGAGDGAAEEALGADCAQEERKAFAEAADAEELIGPGGRVGGVYPGEAPAAVQRGDFRPILRSASGVDAAEGEGVAEGADGTAKGVGGSTAEPQPDEMRLKLRKKEFPADVGVVDAKMGGEGLRGPRAPRLEAEGQGGGINLARTRHFAAYFAQLV